MQDYWVPACELLPWSVRCSEAVLLSAGDFVQAGDMRQALWRVVDAVHAAGKAACAAEYERVCCFTVLAPFGRGFVHASETSICH